MGISPAEPTAIFYCLISYSPNLEGQRVECKILIRKLPRSLAHMAKERNISVTDIALTLNEDQKCFKDHLNKL
jgi:hypothetical protein